MTDPWRLPSDLEVGVATASWQVEGARAQRGRCIWDDFADRPGSIIDGTTADPACRHVERLQEDLDLLAWVGVDAYRFSISWPRVMPDGTGATSPSGLDFYERLVDGLLERGIAPAATLYHWDLPSSLQEKGGWPARATAERFADYAGVMASHLGDRVERWATLNEPWCSAFLGHASGAHAPGWRDGALAYEAAHHLMLGHGWATEQLRAHGARQIGIVLNLAPSWVDSEAGGPAAEHVDDVQNRLFLEALAGRGLPERLVERTRSITDWSFVQETDLAAVAAPLDWLGVNYYSVRRVREGEAEVGPVDPEVAAYPGAPAMQFAPREPTTAMGWEIVPGGLIEALSMAADALPGLPLWVTENGAAFEDSLDGSEVHDQARVEYLQAHLEALDRARQAGLPVRGYYVWSLMDNIEWAHGWTKRFGLVRVDPEDPRRLPKDSALWLRAALAERAQRASSP